MQDVANKGVPHREPVANLSGGSDEEIQRKRTWFQNLGQLSNSLRRLLSSLHNHKEIYVAISLGTASSIRTKEDDFFGMSLRADSARCCLDQSHMNRSGHRFYFLSILKSSMKNLE